MALALGIGLPSSLHACREERPEGDMSYPVYISEVPYVSYPTLSQPGVSYEG